MPTNVFVVDFAVLYTQVLENDANAADVEYLTTDMKIQALGPNIGVGELLYFVCGKWTWAVSMGQWTGPDPGARSSGAFITDSNFFKI